MPNIRVQTVFPPSSNFARDDMTAASSKEHADSAHQRYLGTKFFPALDGLRAMSIIGVMCFHAEMNNPTFFGKQGGFGVDIFFVISGFLITTLLLRERADAGQISLKKFYIRRSLRIFPLYYSVLAIYCLASFLEMRHGAPAGRVFFSNLPWFATFTSNWFIDIRAGTIVHFALAWSLATEEQFYLFWPFVVRFSRKWFTPLIVISALMVLDQIAESITGHEDATSLQRIITSLATPICMGCILAFGLHNRRSFQAIWGIIGNAVAAPVAIAALMLLLVYIPAPHTPLRQPAFLMVAVLSSAIVACAVVGKISFLAPIFTNKFVRHIGVISYGMYLLHMLCMNVAKRTPVMKESGLGRFAVAFVLVVLIASLSYRFYESFFLRLKDKLAGRPVHA